MVSEEGRCDGGLGRGGRGKRSYESARPSLHPRKPKGSGGRRRKAPGESLKQIVMMMGLSEGELSGKR